MLSLVSDRLTAEHITVHADLSLIIHLKLLFSLFLSHAYKPDAFSFGIIIPIVKDSLATLVYLIITGQLLISPVISKLFENVTIELSSAHIILDDDQFRFKKWFDCPSAIFVLR